MKNIISFFIVLITSFVHQTIYSQVISKPMRGIRSNRIISKGYGKSKPVATNELMKEDNLTEELNLK